MIKFTVKANHKPDFNYGEDIYFGVKYSEYGEEGVSFKKDEPLSTWVHAFRVLADALEKHVKVPE